MIKTKKDVKDVKVPEKLVIRSPDDVFWTSVREKCEAEILNAKRNIIINEEILALADRKIAAEQKHLNS